MERYAICIWIWWNQWMNDEVVPTEILEHRSELQWFQFLHLLSHRNEGDWMMMILIFVPVLPIPFPLTISSHTKHSKILFHAVKAAVSGNHHWYPTSSLRRNENVLHICHFRFTAPNETISMRVELKRFWPRVSARVLVREKTKKRHPKPRKTAITTIDRYTNTNNSYYSEAISQ